MKISLGMIMKFYKLNPKNVENKRSYVQHTQIIKIKARTVNKANLLDVVNDQLFDMGSDIEVLEINGSGYAIKQFNTIFIEASTIKPPRGSSYIPTPEPFNNARCGLINIQNDDLKCFEWCMKYHQTKQGKMMIELVCYVKLMIIIIILIFNI